MNDNKSISSNGKCVTGDTNFASKTTVEGFLESLLSVLKANPETSPYFSAENSHDYEVNILPVTLKNTTNFSSDQLLDKRDFASERAEMEAAKIVKGFNFDPKNAELFYSNYYPRFISELKKAFDNPTSYKGYSLGQGQERDNNFHAGNIMLVSQRSYLRLSEAMVNVLLKCHPDGTPCLKRRRKVKPGSNPPVYYSEHEIEELERDYYSNNDAGNFIKCDLGYIPYKHDNFLISAATMLTVDNKSMIYDNTTPEEICASFEGDSEEVFLRCQKLLAIAKRDLEIIETVEKRAKYIPLTEIINSDARDTSSKPDVDDSKMTMKTKYLTLLRYARVLVYLIEDFVNYINSFYRMDIYDKNKIMNLNFSQGEENINNIYEKFLISSVIKENLSKLDPKFIISPKFFNGMIISELKNSLDVASSKLIEEISIKIGFRSESSAFNRQVNNFLSNSRKVAAVEGVSALTSLINSGRESFLGYAYRNADKYYKVIDDLPYFGIELAIIDSCINGSSKGYKWKLLDMDQNPYTFDITQLDETLQSITGSVEPNKIFTKYSTQINKKEEELTSKRVQLDKAFNEIYGETFPSFCVDLPPIPYNNAELKWVWERLQKLEEEVKDIVDNYNYQRDFEDYRAVFFNLDSMKKRYASSEVDDVDLVSGISEGEKRLNDIRDNMNEISDDIISKINKIYESIIFYTNLSNIKFEFIKFDFKFKTLGLEMRFKLEKAYIIGRNNFLVPVSSITENADEFLRSYFTPFFFPFVTTNPDQFSIAFERNDVQGKTNEIVMIVKYGKSDDVHVASKFRSTFYSILNTKRLLDEFKNRNGLGADSEIQVSDIDKDFIISWSRTSEQNAILSGSKGESVLKLIASTRSCYEQYPAYNNQMKRIVERIFQKIYISFMSRIRVNELKKEVNPQRLFSESAGTLGPREAVSNNAINVKSYNFWLNNSMTNTSILNKAKEISEQNFKLKESKQKNIRTTRTPLSRPSNTPQFNEPKKPEEIVKIVYDQKKVLDSTTGFTTIKRVPRQKLQYQGKRIEAMVPDAKSDGKERYSRTPMRHREGIRAQRSKTPLKNRDSTPSRFSQSHRGTPHSQGRFTPSQDFRSASPHSNRSRTPQKPRDSYIKPYRPHSGSASQSPAPYKNQYHSGTFSPNQINSDGTLMKQISYYQNDQAFDGKNHNQPIRPAQSPLQSGTGYFDNEPSNTPPTNSSIPNGTVHSTSVPNLKDDITSYQNSNVTPTQADDPNEEEPEEWDM